MGKGTVIASYLLRVTLRDPERQQKGDAGEDFGLIAPPDALTNDVMAGVIEDEISRKFAGAFKARVTSERTDR